MKFHEYIHYDEKGYEYDDSEWRSIDRDLFFVIKIKNLEIVISDIVYAL